MDVKPQFDQFLKDIRLTENQIQELKTGHTTLRERLWADQALAAILVSEFLQGSYRRYTAVKPKAGKRSDVDVVVVTNLKEQDYTPQQAMNLFKPLLERYYKGKWQFQGRSIGIEMSYVDLDIVLTSAPSEAAKAAVLAKSIREDRALDELYEAVVLRKAVGEAEPAWKSSPLRIPDREAKAWDDTDPLAQMRKTWDKNKLTGGLYVNIVKATKWWRRLNPEPEHPKGYPTEHLVCLACPDTIESVAEGLTLSLERIVSTYQQDVLLGRTPFVPDHGVPAHNVLRRVTSTDFKAFHALVSKAARQARTALQAPTAKESCDKWRELFGQFPEPPSPERGGPGGKGPDTGGYTPPIAPSKPRTERFA
jgi:hypothetical protein